MSRVPALGARPKNPRKPAPSKRARRLKPERPARVLTRFSWDQLEELRRAAALEHYGNDVSNWARRHLLLLAQRVNEGGYGICPLEGGDWVSVTSAEAAVRAAFEDPTILERFRRALGPKQRPRKRGGEGKAQAGKQKRPLGVNRAGARRRVGGPAP